MTMTGQDRDFTEEAHQHSAGLLNLLLEEGAGDVKPLNDRVLTLPLKDELDPMTRTDRKIVVVGSDKAPKFSLVLAVGPGVKGDIEPGAVILHGSYVGDPFEIERRELRLVREADILAVVLNQELDL